ncbi:hypothetical protein FEDK69T_10470 [Flavobacterium enshiense DK69]|nr:hypothetical protein FEDK69T_10470 [Flavobacterium enshiense DK69]
MKVKNFDFCNFSAFCRNQLLLQCYCDAVNLMNVNLKI